MTVATTERASVARATVALHNMRMMGAPITRDSVGALAATITRDGAPVTSRELCESCQTRATYDAGPCRAHSGDVWHDAR